MIVYVPAYLFTDDIQPKGLKLLKITVECFALCIDIILGKLRDDILRGQRVI